MAMRRTRRVDDPPLTRAGVLKLLEKSARQGSVVAQRTVLAELRRREDAERATEALRGTRLPGAKR
jgi:hypothetical protein